MLPKKGRGRERGRGKPVPQQQQQPQDSRAHEDSVRVPGPASEQQEQQHTKNSRVHQASVGVPGQASLSGRVTGGAEASSLQQTLKSLSKKDVYATSEWGIDLEQSLMLRPPSSKKSGAQQAPGRVSESGSCIVRKEAQIPQETVKSSGEKDLHVTPKAFGIYMEESLTVSPPFTKRPNYSTLGRKIGLNVNYFPVDIPSGNVYHYDLEITLKRRDYPPEGAFASPESEKKKFGCLYTKKNREVINTMLCTQSEFLGYRPAYDGRKNLYTKTPLQLDSEPMTITVELPVSVTGELPPEYPLPRAEVFEVSIKPVYKANTNSNAINLDTLHAFYRDTVSEVPKEAIMALGCILRNGPCFRFVPLRRSFFYPPQEPDDDPPLGGGKEIWFGYHQSLILTEWKPVLNIDITATTFRKSGPVIQYVSEILNCPLNDLRRVPLLRDVDVALLSKKMRGVHIKVTHLTNGREFYVLRITRESASKLEFSISTNESVTFTTVSDYIWKKYKIKLDYPHLPCVQVHPEQKKVYIPLELCEILEGQHSNEKMTDSQMTQMISVASVPPEKRFAEIQQALRNADFNNDPCNVEFGVRVSSTPLSVEGRAIDPPSVMYFSQRRTTPKDGSWEMKSEKFFEGASVASWAMLSFVSERVCSSANLQRFSDLLSSVATDCGIQLGNHECVLILQQRNVENTLKNFLEKFPDVKLAVVVLQGKSSQLYGEIKRTAETMLGLITQCVSHANVNKLNTSIIRNICQKINAKMGGINSTLTPGEKLRVFERPVIIIGAYVTHPAPGSCCRPSIAAVVASLDPHQSRYVVSYRALGQYSNMWEKAIEIIPDLKNMILEVLLAFYQHTKGKKPEKIIFYRSGISESQFEYIHLYELNAVRQACISLQADYQPDITFIIVQKKHHTRFIPQNRTDGVGPNRNIPPGTVVDRGVSSRVHFEFFLCSHLDLQGTSRPAHYTVLSDDNKFTSDELQKLTYYLCYIYAPCTRSISVPTPLAYARLAARRAATYLATQLDEASDDSDIFETNHGILVDTWKKAIEIHPKLKSTMFFI